LKSKISVTVESSLLEFLDSLPGESRSGKIERALSLVKGIMAERELRKQLSARYEDEGERVEREAWESAVAEAMWKE